MRDGKAFGVEVVGIVKTFMQKAIDPILARIEAIEQRVPERGEKGERGESGNDGAPGRDAAAPSREQIIDAILSTSGAIDEAVQRHLAANPPAAGKDGRNGQDGVKGDTGKDGRDGVGLAGAIIDRVGNLVVTLTDGTTRELGVVVGKDGDRGSAGSDGADGLGFDDLEVIHDGAREFVFRFAKGERTKEFTFALPVVLDKGVYREGTAYDAGDGVTWAGSFWIAQECTTEKPDSGKGWRLAVKRGRDGKDGALKAEKPREPVRVGVPAKGG